MGRPISLPNLLRLCRRRLAVLGISDASLSELVSVYRRHQPFRRGPQMIRMEKSAKAEP